MEGHRRFTIGSNADRYTYNMSERNYPLQQNSPLQNYPDQHNNRQFQLFDSQRTSATLQDVELGNIVKEKEHSHNIQEHDQHDQHNLQSQPHITFKERLRHFTWAWYTLTMSTGGLALLIIIQPNSFTFLPSIGWFVYVLNLVLFTLVCSAMTARFIIYPSLLMQSLRHEREGLFFPTFWLSIATILTSTHRYLSPSVGDGLLVFMRVAFWIYCACTFTLAVVQYSFLFSTHTYAVSAMMPTWILPAFPIMLSGTIASVIADSQPPHEAIPIIVAGLTFQGLGLSISVMMYAHYIGRMMQTGLPNREHRTGLFICAGPPSFTALALIGMANGLPDNFDLDGNGVLDTQILRVSAITAGAFLWALALWFFFIALIAVIRSPPQHFHLGWWAAVFPNTGFTIATITLGKSFNSSGINIVASGMSLVLGCLWIFVLFNNIKAVINVSIMYPGKDEDVNDH